LTVTRRLLADRDADYKVLVAQNIQHNEKLIDELITKQNQILDNRLGLVDEQDRSKRSDSGGEKQIPLKRPNWNKVRSEYEAKRRDEYWRARIEAIEKADQSRASGSSEVVAEKSEPEAEKK
jgi:hypothetical protein